MLVLVMIPGIGVKVNGARRWLGPGPLQFQPSEIMKLALVLHVAAVISARPKIARSLQDDRRAGDRRRRRGGAADPAQPDLGTEPRDLLHDGARCWSPPGCRCASSAWSRRSAPSW